MDTGLVSDDELNYLEAHFVELRTQYPGEWIAIKDNAVIAHSLNIMALRDVANGSFMTHLPKLGEVMPPFAL